MTDKLIYQDTATVPMPDATVYVAYAPKQWTCTAYGHDHDVSLYPVPSWGDGGVENADGSWTFQLPFGTIVSMQGRLSLTLTAATSCVAGDYSYVGITAYVVVAQRDRASRIKTLPLENGVATVVTITSSNGIISGIQ